jgi:hypothetical protein
MIKKYFKDNLNKYAGIKEKKRAKGINFEHVKNLLSQSGEEVPRSSIDEALNDDSKLIISTEKLNWIESLNLDDQVKRERLSEHETYLFTVGAAITSSSLDEARGKIATLNNYLITNHEIKSGSFNLNLSDLYSADKIKELFDRHFQTANDWERASKDKEKESAGDSYKSNEIIHDFGDGWKVVYVPAVGEMEPFPGIPKSSHDRILEGNKNGLCLGAAMRLYQDNSPGKIYSVRDQSNKPRVTCRIQGKSLLEAKGKNNLPPDVDAAIHATNWFEIFNNLDYKNSEDFQYFPPTKKEEAIEKFSKDINSPYENKWITAWYNQGISAIDDDVKRRIIANDPQVFSSGLGKKYKELVEPVIKYWCNKYVEDDNVRDNVIFGDAWSPPEHEVFKTYRKSPWMFEAVKKLSTKNPELYFSVGLHQIKEYDTLSAGPVENQVLANPYVILKHSDKEWAKPHIESASEQLFKKNPLQFLTDDIIDKDFSKKYVMDVAENFSKNAPYNFLEKYRNSEKMKNSLELKEYIEVAFKKESEENSTWFLDNYGEDSNALPFLNQALKNVLQKAHLKYESEHRKLIRRLIGEYENHITEDMMTPEFIDTLNPEYFIDNFKDTDILKRYIPMIMENFAKKNPITFIGKYGEYAFLNNDDLLNQAIEDVANTDPCYFVYNLSKYPASKEYMERAEIDCLHEDPVDFLMRSGGEKYDDLIKNLLVGEYEYIRRCIYHISINHPNFKNYREFIFSSAAEYYPDLMLSNYVNLGKNSDFRRYADIAINKIINADPRYFIENYFYDEWAEKYMDTAIKSFAIADPYTFLNEYSDYDWAEPYMELANNQILNNSEESTPSTTSSTNFNEKLLKLSKILFSFGAEKESILVSRLRS